MWSVVRYPTVVVRSLLSEVRLLHICARPRAPATVRKYDIGLGTPKQFHVGFQCGIDCSLPGADRFPRDIQPLAVAKVVGRFLGL